MSKEDLPSWPESNQPMQSLWLCKVERLFWIEWLMNWMTVKLCSQQKIVRNQERAEQDFSRRGQDAKHVHLERYHASEPEQQGKWSMSVQPAPHVAHYVAFSYLTGNQHGKIVVVQLQQQLQELLAHSKETKNHIDQMNCVLSLQNAQTNTQNNTGLD